MKHLAAFLLILGALAAGFSCRHPSARESSAEAAIPRPKAWPRTPLYDTIYTPVATGSDILIPAATAANIDGEAITIAYPAYRATMYITDSRTPSPAEAEQTEANRRERIELNIGGRTTEVASFSTPAGYDAQIFTTPLGALTPLQFIARRGTRIVSGALVVDRLPSSADSIAPTLSATERDVATLINALR